MSLPGKIIEGADSLRGLGLALICRRGRTVSEDQTEFLALLVVDDGVEGGSPIICDVSKQEDVCIGFTKTTTLLGGLDILLNNPALAYPQRHAESGDDFMKLRLEVNLLDLTYCMREAISVMCVQDDRDIVNITSELVHTPYPFGGVYAVTKSALEALQAKIRALFSERSPEAMQVTVAGNEIQKSVLLDR